VPLEGVDAAAAGAGSAEDLLALDEALKGLESQAPELARVVEWRFYAGLSEEEIARTLQVSDRTVRRQWRAARAFLYGRLSGAGAGG
jgi:DNA-directed RNA polymerase specialized sigma24 family protein